MYNHISFSLFSWTFKSDCYTVAVFTSVLFNGMINKSIGQFTLLLFSWKTLNMCYGFNQHNYFVLWKLYLYIQFVVIYIVPYVCFSVMLCCCLRDWWGTWWTIWAGLCVWVYVFVTIILFLTISFFFSAIVVFVYGYLLLLSATCNRSPWWLTRWCISWGYSSLNKCLN